MENKKQIVSEKCDDYMIDIVKTSSYQNQTEEYCNKFKKWRTRKNNKYGYDYVKDTRERTYVDGQGYVHHSPLNAEKNALANCFKLFGSLLIIKQLLNVLQSFVIQNITGNLFFSPDYYSSNVTNESASLKLICVVCGFNILQLIIPIILFFAITKMPLKVAIPNGNEKNHEISLSGISIMLMVLVFGRIGNYILGDIFAYINIFIPNFDMIHSDNTLAMIIYAVSECIILPILIEICYRGIILQTFRQHGDLFALTMACIINCISYSDITKMGYILLTSVVVGLFTLRSGSIYTAIFMRISSRLTSLVLSFGLFYVDKEYKILLELVIFFIIIAFALSTYSRMIRNKNCDFNIVDTRTHLTMKNRLIIFLSSKEITIWLVIVLISMIFNIRFIK